MKTYRQFINENIKSILQPKSEEEIHQLVNNKATNPIDLIWLVKKYNLPDSYLPSVEQLADAIEHRKERGYDYSDDTLIDTIIRYKLDYRLLPRNRKGWCICGLPNGAGRIDLNNCGITELPDKLKVRGLLNCSNNELTSLPNNLIVNGTLDCSENKITSLPPTIRCYTLHCDYNKLTEIPKGLKVKSNLTCSHNEITKLPSGIKFPYGTFDCSYNHLTEIPKDLFAKFFNCSHNQISELPRSIIVTRKANISHNKKELKKPKDRPFLTTVYG